MTARLGAWALFAGALSAAGLPIYIHAPKFYVDTYGVGLGALGGVLFALRLFDVVQDPLLGRLAEATRARRAVSVWVALGVMGLGMLGLFAVSPPVPPLWWFALTLTLVFSGFSFLTIVFYAAGVAKAEAMPGQGHLRLARWRETGALSGVSLAALLPTVLAAATMAPFAGYAMAFVALCAVAGWAMADQWGQAATSAGTGFGTVLRDRPARFLLVLALVNAAPVAVTSTLFLFFVESVLAAPGMEGPLLLLFFVAAAGAAPGWGWLAERWGARRSLLAAMVLAILSFVGALFLGPGDSLWFALICLASGATVGADLTLLPALFAARLARVSRGATDGFALWAFMSKFSLAIAAAVLLPALDTQSYVSGASNDDQALRVLSWLYAGVPCGLKLLAIGLLLAAPLEET